MADGKGLQKVQAEKRMKKIGKDVRTSNLIQAYAIVISHWLKHLLRHCSLLVAKCDRFSGNPLLTALNPFSISLESIYVILCPDHPSSLRLYTTLHLV